MKNAQPENPWIHRSSGMKCMWFVVKKPSGDPSLPPNNIGKNLGRCRRHAPSMTGYPAVFEDDWCGDHKI